MEFSIHFELQGFDIDQMLRERLSSYRFARTASVFVSAICISPFSSSFHFGLPRYSSTLRSFTSARRRLLKSINRLNVSFASHVQSDFSLNISNRVAVSVISAKRNCRKVLRSSVIGMVAIFCLLALLEIFVPTEFTR